MQIRYLVRFASALVWLVIAGQLAAADTQPPTRETYLTVAKQGWVFDFHGSLKRRSPKYPPVQFDGREPSTGPVCVFGAPAHPLSRDVLTQFEGLLGQIFARTAPITFAGARIADCPPSQRVYLRLYGGAGSNDTLNVDLRKLDQGFGFDLPKGRFEKIRSPGQGLGLFGRNGNVAHLLVRQPSSENPSVLERAFYRSILIEELFQAFSFGLDILKFDFDTPFLSKLQEYPDHLKHLDWNSPEYMRRLLASNPSGLCAFDVFMLHALAQMPLKSSNSNAFLAFIEGQFDLLLSRTQASLSDPRFDLLFDKSCLRTPVLASQ